MTPRPHFARWLPLVAFALLGVGGCGGADGRPPTMLAEYNVLVVTPEATWATLSDLLAEALVVRPFGQPAENPFRLTHRDPARVTTADLSRYRMILLVGGRDAMGNVLGQAAGALPEAPSIATHSDVWVEGQDVAVMLLPDGPAGTGDEATLQSLASEASELLHAGLARWSVVRTYANGTSSAVDTLSRNRGFGINVPVNYRLQGGADSVLVVATPFNDADPTIRTVLVTWRPFDETEVTPAMALDWRDAVVPDAYDWTQTTRRDPIEVSTPEGDPSALQVEGFWSAIDDGQPLGGSFVLRVVDCPAEGRRYLLDSWLYAPNRGKYRYLMEVETVLDTFRCSPEAGG